MGIAVTDQRKALNQIEVEIKKLITIKISSRAETTLALRAVQQAQMWLGKTKGALGNTTPYVQSSNPENKFIEPRADVCDGNTILSEEIDEITAIKELRAALSDINKRIEKNMDVLKDVNSYQVCTSEAWIRACDASMWLGMVLNAIYEEVPKEEPVTADQEDVLLEPVRLELAKLLPEGADVEEFSDEEGFHLVVSEVNTLPIKTFREFCDKRIIDEDPIGGKSRCYERIIELIKDIIKNPQYFLQSGPPADEEKPKHEGELQPPVDPPSPELPSSEVKEEPEVQLPVPPTEPVSAPTGEISTSPITEKSFEGNPGDLVKSDEVGLVAAPPDLAAKANVPTSGKAPALANKPKGKGKKGKGK